MDEHPILAIALCIVFGMFFVLLVLLLQISLQVWYMFTIPVLTGLALCLLISCRLLGVEWAVNLCRYRWKCTLPIWLVIFGSSWFLITYGYWYLYH